MGLDELLTPGSWTGPDAPVVVLPAGDVTEGVVRVADTVRRPRQAQSRGVAALLLHLERAGFDGAPRFLGTDAEGRDVLDHLPGQVAGSPVEAWAADDALLAPLGALVRRMLDAAAGFVPPVDAEWFREQRPDTPEDAALLPTPTVVGHNDVTPQNVVVRDGVPVAVLDFDLAGPTTPLRECVNTCLHWAPLRAPEDLEPAFAHLTTADLGRRCRLVADGFGLGDADRERFVDTAVTSARVGHRRMHRAAVEIGGGWARMWSEGVGDLIARRERWLLAEGDVLTAALLDRRAAGGPAS